jgi:hypothetical protein
MFPTPLSFLWTINFTCFAVRIFITSWRCYWLVHTKSLIYPADWSCSLIRKDGTLVPGYTLSHSRRRFDKINFRSEEYISIRIILILSRPFYQITFRVVCHSRDLYAYPFHPACYTPCTTGFYCLELPQNTSTGRFLSAWFYSCVSVTCILRLRVGIELKECYVVMKPQCLLCRARHWPFLLTFALTVTLHTAYRAPVYAFVGQSSDTEQ